MQPGPRDADDTLRQLISVIDNREVYDAVVQLLRAENPERSFARPALGGYAAERPCRAGQGAAKARYIIRTRTSCSVWPMRVRRNFSALP